MTELVKDGSDGLVVTAKTAAGLARALNVYTDNPGLAARHGQAALESMSNLELDRFSQTWLEIYEQTV